MVTPTGGKNKKIKKGPRTDETHPKLMKINRLYCFTKKRNKRTSGQSEIQAAVEERNNPYPLSSKKARVRLDAVAAGHPFGSLSQSDVNSIDPQQTSNPTSRERSPSTRGYNSKGICAAVTKKPWQHPANDPKTRATKGSFSSCPNPNLIPD